MCNPLQDSAIVFSLEIKGIYVVPWTQPKSYVVSKVSEAGGIRNHWLGSSCPVGKHQTWGTVCSAGTPGMGAVRAHQAPYESGQQPACPLALHSKSKG